MDDFRSKSYNNDGRLQIIEGDFNNNYSNGSYGSKTNNNPNSSGFQDFRSYSTSYASSSAANKETNLDMVVNNNNNGKEVKLKKGKSTNGSLSKSWSLNDPELQRKKRVASYKVYSVEGKVKGSFKNSFRWLKERCTKVVYGWR